MLNETDERRACSSVSRLINKDLPGGQEMFARAPAVQTESFFYKPVSLVSEKAVGRVLCQCGTSRLPSEPTWEFPACCRETGRSIVPTDTTATELGLLLIPEGLFVT